jgi:hypothetical protein
VLKKFSVEIAIWESVSLSALTAGSTGAKGWLVRKCKASLWHGEQQ